jgi:myo-inositol-1(or 4)-monophosphatase
MGEVAMRAALTGGAVVLGADQRRDGSAKGLPGDYVTATDLASEHAIRAYLASATPGVPMVGEEDGGATAGGPYWLVDPLDGTTNFMHGFPVVGVSVALIEDGRAVAGCVHGPFLCATYLGTRGQGAFSIGLDGARTRLRVSERGATQAVVATGFPFRHKDLMPRYLRMFESALGAFEDLRRPGAAAMDLAWVAAGVFDGFFELALSPWDVAAGGLLVQEAGGVVTDWEGDDDFLPGTILAGSAAVHEQLRGLADATKTDDLGSAPDDQPRAAHR